MEERIINDFTNQADTQGKLAKTFMSNVFTYMTMALVISALTAYVFASSNSLLGMLYNLETGSLSIIGWVVMLGPLGLVLLMGARIQKMSYSSMLGVFVLFAALMGASLSSIFFTYSLGSIATTFFVSAGTFAVMAVVGYTTSTDLTKFGSLLYMALIGLIIAMVVNWFLGSSTMDYVISGLGVLIFTGLTAYDTQKLKQIGMQVDANSESGKKMIIWGALSLYLDFINLFLFLLRFLGGRD